MALAYTLCEALRHKVLRREYGKIVRAPTLTSLKDGRSSAKAVADKAGESGRSRDGYATRTQGLVGEMPGESVCGSRNAERGGRQEIERKSTCSVARRVAA
jgi:hypothetical protein